MKQLNRMRLAAGLPIDPSIEVTEKPRYVTEARETPRRKSDLKKPDIQALKRKVRGCEVACKHIKAAVEALEKVPATDFSGDVPRFIGELEDLLDTGGHSGMDAYLEMISSDLRKAEGKEKSAKREEEQEKMYDELEATQQQNAFDSEVEADRAAEQKAGGVKEDNEVTKVINALSQIDREKLEAAMDVLKQVANGSGDGTDSFIYAKEIVGESLIDEAMHYYGVEYQQSHTAQGDKPINVSDGSSNKDQYMDALKPTKDESPTQLRTMDQQDDSPQDKSGDDLNTKVKVPNGIKQALKTEINKAKAEANKLDVRDKEASYFYKDLAKAFEDLLTHLDKGTRYDIKQAQIFAQTLMGPMLHKIPTNVWKFLANGGETRSLKSYMKKVDKKYPITGPRNALK